MAKKKRSKQLLLIDKDCLTSDEMIISLDEIKTRLFKIMSRHVGKESAITPYDLFFEIFNTHPEEISRFQREYWYNVIKALIAQLRREDRIFIINQGHFLFTLKTREESQAFKKRIDASIENLENVKLKADKWVREERYKDL